MKTIEFRAYDNQTKNFEHWNSRENKFDGIFWLMIKRPEFEEPEQYTGLKDKNGKDVFEGDIIEYRNDIENGKGIIWHFLDTANLQCEWFEQNTSSPSLFTSIEYLGCSSEIEIIGNIHENLELLKEGL